MWLYFNQNGTLVEAGLQHGPAARSGTTDFQIFAYFENVDLTVNNFATIKLIKPDLNDSSYPLIAMRRTVMKYEKMPGENSNYFKEDGGPTSDGYYPGFVFDFSNFSGDQNVAILLDTPGLWQAIVSLYSLNHIISVQGTATFNVQYGNVIDEGTDISIDELMAAFSAAISGHLSIEDGVLVCSSIPENENDVYEIGQWILLNNASHLELRQKTLNIVNEQETTSWDIKFDFKDYFTKAESQALLNDYGRFLGYWHASHGWLEDIPASVATEAFYYKKGDYALVGMTGNLIPVGDNIPQGTTYGTFPHQQVSENVIQNDIVFYTGNGWVPLRYAKRNVSFSQITGQPTDNANLVAALDELKDQKDFVVVSRGLWTLGQNKTYCFNSEANLPTSISELNSKFGINASYGEYQVVLYMAYEETTHSTIKYRKAVYKFVHTMSGITWTKVHDIAPGYIYGYLPEQTGGYITPKLFNYIGINYIEKSTSSSDPDYYVVSPFDPVANFEPLIPEIPEVEEQTDYIQISQSIFANAGAVNKQTKTYVFDSLDDLPTTSTDFNNYFGTTLPNSGSGSGVGIIVGIITDTTSSSYWGVSYYICSGSCINGTITYSTKIKYSSKRFYGVVSNSGTYVIKLYKPATGDGFNISVNPTVEQRTRNPFDPADCFRLFDKLGVNSSGYGVLPPDTSGWSSNKILATTDQLSSYTAGSGINISSNAISVDTDIIPNKAFVSNNYATKTEVATLKSNIVVLVNTTTYPTLADFLASDGEEGKIYWYPIDTTDLTKGYQTYVWENNAYIFAGNTIIDLTSVIALGIQFTTTAPTAANTNGLKVVVLSSEPQTRYGGYIYIITGNNQ